jgi:hypothetical protein
MKCAPLLLLAAARMTLGQTAQIEGMVVDGRGGEAWARARVQLAGAALQAVTDDKGRFRIEEIPAGVVFER